MTIMNDKIICEVFLPASSASFDVRIPRHLRLSEVMSLLSHAMIELSGGSFAPTTETTVCDKNTGAILNLNMNADELGLVNGSALMLI